MRGHRSWPAIAASAARVGRNIRVDREQPPAELAGDVTSAVRRHFEREASLQDLRRRRIVREGRLSLAIGLLVLVLCMGSAALVPIAALGTGGEILRESLVR